MRAIAPTRLGRLPYSLLTSVRKRLGLPHSLGELDPYLTSKELLFRAPPLTPDLVAAIKLISPQFRLRPDERSRRFWELNQNGLCWGELEALEPYLRRLGTPSKVLDIGPGMGRSAAFFKKALGWDDVPFVLYEGTGEKTIYTKAGPRFDDSFCGNIAALEAILRFNGTRAFEIADAHRLASRLNGLAGPFGFIYSFFAVGFHWSIGPFLDELLALMDERSIGAFTLHDRFEDEGELGTVPHRIVTFRRSWPRHRRTRMLILAKSEERLAIAGSAVSDTAARPGAGP